MQTMLPEGRPVGPDTATEACKALVHRVIEEAVTGGRLSVLDEPPDATCHGDLPGVDGPDEVKDLLAVYRETVSKAHWSIEGKIADGEMASVESGVKGTGGWQG